MKSFFKKYGVNFVYVIILAIIVTFFVWASYDYQRVVNNSLLSEARIIGYQVSALRSYIQHKQTEINKDSSGADDFKGIFPDVAVKEVSEILKNTPYFTIRQVSQSPRNEDNAPDSFESERLSQFKKDAGIRELYADSTVNGQKAFRYMMPLRVDPSCLPCHGEPKGEFDVTGFKKEGYKIGDLIGAVSINIQSYEKFILIRRNTSYLLLFVFLMMITISIIIYSIRNNFDEQVAEIRNTEKASLVTFAPNSLDAQMMDKFHKLIIHNLKNPLAEVIDSANALKDVPLNVLENSLAASNKISAYESKIIELKKLELGKQEILLEKFDFEPVFKTKLKAYENAAQRSGVKFEGKSIATTTKINSDKNLIFKGLDLLFLSVLKFTRKTGGQINMTLIFDTDSNKFFVTVVNNSIRIGAAYEKFIFEKFADIKDINESFLFNTETELIIAKLTLNQLNCELSFDVSNKEFNAFYVVIPIGI